MFVRRKQFVCRNKERKTSKWNSVAHCRCANDQVSCSLAVCIIFYCIYFLTCWVILDRFSDVVVVDCFFFSSLLPPSTFFALAFFSLLLLLLMCMYAFVNPNVESALLFVSVCRIYLNSLTHLIQVSVQFLLLFVSRTEPLTHTYSSSSLTNTELL